MARKVLKGWSGQFDCQYNALWGGSTVYSPDKQFSFNVIFHIDNLYVDGQSCIGNIYDYLEENCCIHFDAKCYDKPFYDMFDDEDCDTGNIWYEATCVWIGSKPNFDYDDDDDESTTDYYDPDEPDVTCQSGTVIKFINKNLAIMESVILDGDTETRVALERCRMYVDGEQCSDLSQAVKIGDMLLYEGFLLPDKKYAKTGVAYRVGLAWIGDRPNIDLHRPTHELRL